MNVRTCVCVFMYVCTHACMYVCVYACEHIVTQYRCFTTELFIFTCKIAGISEKYQTPLASAFGIFTTL